MNSDLKNWDVYKDPLWLLHNLYKKYKVIIIPTAGGWSTSNTLSGAVAQTPFYLRSGTGATANSRGLARCYVFGLNSSDRSQSAIDYSKRLELEFVICEDETDGELIARIQLKQVGTEGDLADVGLGLRIDGLTVLGEAYGSARNTVNLGILSAIQRIWRVKIVLVPNDHVEFWVNGNLVGTLTGNAVPTGVLAPTLMVVSAINGPTGGPDAGLMVSNIRFVQRW